MPTNSPESTPNPANADISTLERLRAQLGKEVVVTRWVTLSQQRIDQFAEATGDFQWIHVDPVRAAAESPFGGSIAHGFLTLSLLGKFYAEDVVLPFCAMGLNYGLNKVRFMNPVRAGSRVRGRFVLKAIEDIEGGLQLSWTVVFELEGQDKPACIAESVVRQYFSKS
jgi:acyl dehydratase